MNVSGAELQGKMADRRAVVAVVGLGYVGLPLSVVFAEAGFEVYGIDTDPERVALLNSGESYLEDVSTEAVGTLTRARRFTATSDHDVIGKADAAIICVPTPLGKSKEPDLSHIIAAVEKMSPLVHEGMLVVLESTTYPMSTEEVVGPRLLANSPKELEVGRDVFVAFSPERVDPGQSRWTISNTPKIVGGMTPACTEVASALYGAVVDRVVPVSSSRTAEMVKLLENTFRAANIALANEAAMICDRLGVDVWEVIEAAGTKPFGFMPFYPGPGLGGHCIPVDPQYLAWKLKTLDYTARFIQLAEEINTSMPLHVVGKIADVLNDDGKALKGARVLILGVAYKRDVRDTRESPALDLVHLLSEKGASVAYHDPLVPSLRHAGLEMDSVGTERQQGFDEAVEGADCVVIVTDHSSYDWQWVVDRSRRVVDTRNATGGTSSSAGKVTRL